MEFNLYLDRKNTVWVREYFTVEADSLDEAMDQVINDEVSNDDCETLYDTMEYMLPEENDSYSTEELYNADTDKIIWQNGN